MSSNPPSDCIQHIVRPGEVLSAIADQHGIKLDALLAANPQIQNPDLIQVGQVIIIPASSAPPGDPGAPAKTQPASSTSSGNTKEQPGIFFAGFDRSAYPGDDLMRLLRTEAHVAWTGFYLAPAPSHPDKSWMEKRSFLKDLGFGFAPIYVGQQQQGSPGSHALAASQGTIDGKKAAELAQAAGFPKTSVLYLDIETGPPPRPELVAYYKAWFQSVKDNEFSPGVYCSHLLAPTLVEQAKAVVWIFHLKFSNGHSFVSPLPTIDPSQSNFTKARMMQYAQQGSIRLGTKTLTPIDLNSSHRGNPSEV